jgi:hypothetical protein
VGLACLGSFLLLLALHGKGYYVGPVYPTLYAAGAAALDRLRRPRLRRALAAAVAVLVVAYGLLALPIGLPIVPPAAMARYAVWMGMQAALRTNRGELGRLPQDYADMLGWPEQVAAVARVYHALPATERARAVIVADDYGEAGALDFYGPRLGLPKTVCPCGSYWFFGPGAKSGEVLVTLGVERAPLRRYFDSVETAARFDHPWMVAEERDIEINIARRPRTTLQAIWPSLAGQN